MQTTLSEQKKITCKVASSQEKIIRIEINHFKQICKRKKSINKFEDENKMKRETHKFAKGRKNNCRNKYNHTNL